MSKRQQVQLILLTVVTFTRWRGEGYEVQTAAHRPTHDNVFYKKPATRTHSGVLCVHDQ